VIHHSVFHLRFDPDGEFAPSRPLELLLSENPPHADRTSELAPFPLMPPFFFGPTSIPQQPKNIQMMQIQSATPMTQPMTMPAIAPELSPEDAETNTDTAADDDDERETANDDDEIVTRGALELLEAVTLVMTTASMTNV